MLYGPGYGALIGGVGSAVADILGGYPVWAPITLLSRAGGIHSRQRCQKK